MLGTCQSMEKVGSKGHFLILGGSPGPWARRVSGLPVMSPYLVTIQQVDYFETKALAIDLFSFIGRMTTPSAVAPLA